jgi:hypothetical protein
MNYQKFEDQVRKIIEADGDRCSVCGEEFPHKSQTYAGELKGGRAAVVGSCCLGKMKAIIGTGIYLKPVKEISKTCH